MTKHKNPKICVKTRADRQIGGGHIHRCRVLAEQLAMLGCDIFWHVNDTARAYLPTNAQICPNINDNYRQFDWLIADDYSLTPEWEQAIICKKLIFSDLANRTIWGDIILNQNPSANSADYEAYNPNGALILAGLEYCLIKPQLRDLPVKNNQNIQHILVQFGLSNRPPGRQLWDYIGQNPQYIFKILSNLPPPLTMDNLIYCPPSDDIASHYQWADCAIGAGGVSALERAYLGINSLIIPLADNQLAPARALCSLGLAVFCPSFENLAQYNIHQLTPIPNPRAHIDGLGAERVANIMLDY